MGAKQVKVKNECERYTNNNLTANESYKLKQGQIKNENSKKLFHKTHLGKFLNLILVKNRNETRRLHKKGSCHFRDRLIPD